MATESSDSPKLTERELRAIEALTKKLGPSQPWPPPATSEVGIPTTGKQEEQNKKPH